jgi:hypothetical protein
VNGETIKGPWVEERNRGRRAEQFAPEEILVLGEIAVRFNSINWCKRLAGILLVPYWLGRATLRHLRGDVDVAQWGYGHKPIE